MALGIGLLMPPGSDGRPMMVYLADLEIVCAACGMGAAKRYVLSTRFHVLTVARLEQHLFAIPAAIEGECGQCGADFSPEAVARWSLQYAPGDGDGLLVGLCDHEGLSSWRVFPHAHLDVQGIPILSFEADDISSVALESLTEPQVFATLGRYLNPKAAIRRAILRATATSRAPLPKLRDEGAQGLWIEPAPGLVVWLGPSAATPSLVDDAPPASRGVLLVEDGLLVDGYPDAPARWLADLHPQLEGRSLVVFASVEEVDAALRRHFSRFPVDISYVDEGDTLRVVAGDGSESTSVLRFERASIAEEAARTGAAPGDLARVEIDRAMTLLDLAPR